jgi:4-hydroxy-tetrahydrodipicolinate reductase
VKETAQQPDELAIQSVREGNVPGTHTISYASEADSIIITHQANNRSGFALGAVLAAEYTAAHTGLLTMSDLFPFLK